MPPWRITTTEPENKSRFSACCRIAFRRQFFDLLFSYNNSPFSDKSDKVLSLFADIW